MVTQMIKIIALGQNMAERSLSTFDICVSCLYFFVFE